MTAADVVALLPLIVLCVASLAVLLLAAVRRSHPAVALLSLAGLAAALAALPVAAAHAPRQITPLLILDRYGIFYMGLVLAAGIVVVLLSYIYFRDRLGPFEEYYLLLLVAILGASALVASTHFVTFFLGLEILSVSLYALIAYPRAGGSPLEAGVKYLILAAAAAAFLLFGMALIYAELGTMSFSRMADLLAAREDLRNALLLPGLALMVVGIGFKLAVVPFHMWTPDVYEGARAPVTAFVATVSKGAVVALLLRYFVGIGADRFAPLVLVFAMIAIASMLMGNLLALLQRNVKRLLAYSSIAHMGYILVAFLAGGATAVEAVTFYLVAYVVTILAAFGVVAVLSGRDREADDIDDYRGLFRRRPWTAAIFSASLLSLAGIPLTAGFVGKFYVLAAGIGSAQWALVAVLIASSAIGIYYYLRIVVVMYAYLPEAPSAAGPPLAPPLSLLGGLLLAVLTILLVWLGVYPAPMMRMIQAAGLLG
jgi:NADH-quinone oxidoreductase subunit N